MNRGLLSGLNKAEERPYEGWKTNSFASSDSPEKDDVCLLENDDSTTGVDDSPNSRKCISDGHRNPSEYDSKGTSYKIPKKTVSTDIKDRRMSSWIEVDPSFNKKDFLPGSNCQTGLSNEKQRNYGHHSTQKNEIGYRIRRQAFFTPRRFKHADAPGWRGCTSPTSQQEKIFSCQVPDTRYNGDVPTDNGKQSVQRPFKTLDEEREHNRSVLDSILQQITVPTVGLNKVCESEGKNSRTNSTDSDTNFETNASTVPQQDIPTSSKDENFDDLFSDHCENCTGRLSHDKKCVNCDKHMFPSQAATPCKPLSPERFYSGDSQKPKVQRTHSKTRGNGIRLLTTGTVAKHTDDKNTNGSCQTNSRVKKRKNKGKPLSNIPAPAASITGQMEKRFSNVEREVQEMKASLEYLKKKVATCSTGTCSPNNSPSGLKLHENDPALTPAVNKPEIWHDGINLLTVKAPPKEPQKCALHLLDKLFTKRELCEGILFQSKRSPKPPLDEARVSKMFDVLNAQYTTDKIQKYRQAIIDACNRKCRYVARKELAGTVLKCTNDTANFEL